MTNQFLYLYPIPEYIDEEIKNNFRSWKYGTGKDNFAEHYKEMLNKCIHERYRENNFEINFLLFKNHKISDVIELNSKDRIFYANVNFKNHCSKEIYPNPDFILNQLPKNFDHLRIAGFHIWDCVERVAKRAYEKKFDVLVDEDLTEFFPSRLRYRSFNSGYYPSYEPWSSLDDNFIEAFFKARQNKPWMWQKYD